MAKNFQLQKKNEDGTLEIVHPETNSGVVKHGDKNVDEVLDAKLPYIKSVEINYGTRLVDLDTILSSGSGEFYGVAKFTGLFNGHYFCDLNVKGGISYITDTKTGAVYSNQSNNSNLMGIHTLLTDQYKVNNLKTINGQSLIGNGNIEVQPTLVSGTNIKTINGQSILGSGNIAISSSSSSSSYEEITDGMFEIQDALTIYLDGYNSFIIIFEEIMGVEQPQTNIEISNSSPSLSLRLIPEEYAIGIPFIVKLERINDIDFVLTASGGCIPVAGIVVDFGEGIGFSFEDGTQSEMYYYRVFGK